MTGRVAGVAPVVVRGGHEADPEALLQVATAEPLEGAVARHDLDQVLHLEVVLPPVAVLVGVRDDQYVVRVVLGAQAPVEVRQVRRRLDADALHADVPEEHVVVTAALAGRRPLVAREDQQLALAVVLPDRLVQLFPQAVGKPDVVLAHRDEVQPGVVAGEGEVAPGRALALGESRVAVGLAPEQALFGIGLDPYGIRGARHLAVRAAERVAMDALALRRDLHQVDRLAGR